MKFTPKTEKEIREDGLMPEGEYPFVISNAEDKISKSGDEMIKLLIRVFNPDGSFNLVNDYLLESVAFKLRHACEACGLLDKYESGSLLAADFIGKKGMLKLSIRKDTTGQYGDQNKVKDYIVTKDGEEKKQIPKNHLQKVLNLENRC